MNEPDFWQDQNQAKVISKKVEDLKLIVEQWENLSQAIDDNFDFAKEAIRENDDSVQQELLKELKNLNTV